MAWNQSRNDALMIRLYSYAQQIRALAWESFQLAGLAQANGVLDDPAFVDARGVSKADAAEVLAVSGEVIAFLQNGQVAAKDREAVLNRMLAGPTT